MSKDERFRWGRGLLGAWCLIWATSCKAPPEAEQALRPVQAHCVQVQQASMRDVRVLRGTVVAAPDDDVVVASQVAGRLQKVYIREGDVVPQGATIAQVDSQPAADALRQAQAQLLQAEAQAQNADVTYQRTLKLLERGIVPKQQVDDARSRQTGMRAALEGAHAAVNLANKSLGRTKVTTSTDGVVLHLLRREGELVDGTPATPIAEIADPNDLEFLASALPADLIALRSGQTGQLHFEALPDIDFSVQVRAVSPAVDPSTGVGSIRLVIPTQKTLPPLGLFGTASIDVGTPRVATTVLPGALRNAWAGGREVVVCQAGRAHVQTVEVGQRDANRVEIVRGLDAHARVVVDNVIGLEDGTALVEAP